MPIPALRRLGLVVQAPPPWFWLGGGQLWLAVGRSDLGPEPAGQANAGH